MDDPLTQDELLEILTNRRNSYAFLSRVYREEVSVELLAQLIEEMTRDEVPAAAQGVSMEGKEALRAYAESIRHSELKAVVTQLAVEYASLFLNVGQHHIAPYESIYTSGERLLMQRARDEVFALYRNEGLARDIKVNEPEDHIATELEFMSYLCQKAMQSVEKIDWKTALRYLEKQGGFLEEHLLAWIPAFCKELARTARPGFYRGMAQLTDDFVCSDPQMLGMLIEEIQIAPTVGNGKPLVGEPMKEAGLSRN